MTRITALCPVLSCRNRTNNPKDFLACWSATLTVRRHGIPACQSASTAPTITNQTSRFQSARLPMSFSGVFCLTTLDDICYFCGLARRNRALIWRFRPEGKPIVGLRWVLASFGTHRFGKAESQTANRQVCCAEKRCYILNIFIDVLENVLTQRLKRGTMHV